MSIIYTYRINIPNLREVKVEKYEPGNNAPAEISGKFDASNLPRIRQLDEKARKDEIDSSEVEELGELLFRTVFDDRLKNDFFNFYDQTLQKEALLRVELKTDEPDVIDLPWEFIRNPADIDRIIRRRILIAIDPNITFSRWQPHERVPRPIQLKMGERLRIAVVVSNPSDPDLGAVKYEDTLGALRQLAQEERLELSELISPEHPIAKKSVDEILRDKKPHIFHFIGHGRLRQENGTRFGEIAFIDPITNSSPEWIRAEDFGELFARHQPGIVVLQACETGAVPLSEPFVGIASRVIQQNIPVVVAMQYEVSNQTARKFSLEFYKSLARFEPVDTAVQEGRRAVRLNFPNSPRDFAIPVIFMRIRDGNLFEHQNLSVISELKKKAGEEEENAAYEEAVKTWERIRRVDPEYSGIDKTIMELRQKIAQKPAESFYKTLAELLYHGEIIFFLGSESLLSNPSLFLSDKVAERLAEGSDYGTFGNIRNSLPMISQYVEMTKTRNSLLRTINEIIGQECVGLQPHPFADLLSRLKSPALIISSSYENGLETALQHRNMKFAVIPHHFPSEGQLIVMKRQGNTMTQELCTADSIREMKLFENGYSVIYKICGSLNLCNPGQTDPMMITEKDFFTFLKRKIPDYLIGLFSQKNLLFMGYNLREWYDRLIVSAVLDNIQSRSGLFYAVRTNPEPFETAFWRRYNVQLHEIETDNFIACLSEKLEEIQ